MFDALGAGGVWILVISVLVLLWGIQWGLAKKKQKSKWMRLTQDAESSARQLTIEQAVAIANSRQNLSQHIETYLGELSSLIVQAAGVSASNAIGEKMKEGTIALLNSEGFRKKIDGWNVSHCISIGPGFYFPESKKFLILLCEGEKEEVLKAIAWYLKQQ